MAKPTGRVTAAQVARRSGVSQATVSYVLNDNPLQKISDETRERVLRAVDELGYTPFEPARTLRSGQSSMVLFVTPDYPFGHVIGEFHDRLVTLLAAQGRTVLTHRLTDKIALLDIVRALSPFAVISMAPVDAAQRAQLEALGTRVETIGFREDGEPGSVDYGHPQERVGRIQAQHLFDRGHRRLAYALPGDTRAEMFYGPRLEAIRAFCAAHALPEPLLGDVPSELARASATVGTWHDAGVTGVCAFTDDVALSVIGGAHAAGLRVPEDLAVVGVDDIPLAAVSVPPLTTVHLDSHAMARDLVRPLGVVDDPPGDRPDSAPVWIVERAST